MSMIRTFVAVEMSNDIKGRCGKIIERLEPTTPTARWVDLDTLHLSLKFLGDVDDREVHKVCQATKEVVQPHTPFSIRCKKLVAMPSIDRVRTIGMDVEIGAEELTALHLAIDEKMATLGFPREHRQFKPHLTLGRVKDRRGVTPELIAQLNQYADFSAGEAHIDEVIVYSSFVDRGVPSYDAMSRIELTG